MFGIITENLRFMLVALDVIGRLMSIIDRQRYLTGKKEKYDPYFNQINSKEKIRMEKDTQIIKNTSEPSIRLSKLSKGDYSWEIRISGEDTKKLIEDIKEINDQMKKEFIKEKK